MSGDNSSDDEDNETRPPVKQQRKSDVKDFNKAVVAVKHDGASIVDDEDEIDAAILTSLAQCRPTNPKPDSSRIGSGDVLQHAAVAGTNAKIARGMSVSEVSAKLRSVSIDETVVQKLADECVDGDALHNFNAGDFEHFGIKYGPMVKIRSLLL